MPVSFGDFQPLCSNTPSYPWCNLFYAQVCHHQSIERKFQPTLWLQLLRSSSDTLTGLSIPTSSAPVGVNPSCGIPLLNQGGSVSNVANIAACGVSILFTGFLIAHCHRRKAAVGMCLTFTLIHSYHYSWSPHLGRRELLLFLILYLFTLAFQLVTTGSFLEQGTRSLVIVTAIHAGLVITLFWVLLANALVATQVVEDGTLSSLIVRFFNLRILLNSKKNSWYISLYSSSPVLFSV